MNKKTMLVIGALVGTAAGAYMLARRKAWPIQKRVAKKSKKSAEASTNAQEVANRIKKTVAEESA